MNPTLQTFVCLLVSRGNLNFLRLLLSVDNIVKSKDQHNTFYHEGGGGQPADPVSS